MFAFEAVEIEKGGKLLGEVGDGPSGVTLLFCEVEEEQDEEEEDDDELLLVNLLLLFSFIDDASLIP